MSCAESTRRPTNLVIAGDEVVWRTNNLDAAGGYAACYDEHVGDECEVAVVDAGKALAVIEAAKGGAS